MCLLELDSTPATCEHVVYLYPGEAVIGRRPSQVQGHRRSHLFRDEHDYRIEGIRKAERRARMFARKNGLHAMATLTFRGAPPLDEVRSEQQKHLRRCRRVSGPFPWLMVTEVGLGGRAHGHVLVRPGHVARVAATWGHGHAYRSHWEADGLVAYIAKEWATTPPGQHRYQVARGDGTYAPHPEVRRYASREAALDGAYAAMGADCDLVTPWADPVDPPWLIVRQRASRWRPQTRFTTDDPELLKACVGTPAGPVPPDLGGGRLDRLAPAEWPNIWSGEADQRNSAIAAQGSQGLEPIEAP